MTLCLLDGRPIQYILPEKWVVIDQEESGLVQIALGVIYIFVDVKVRYVFISSQQSVVSIFGHAIEVKVVHYRICHNMSFSGNVLCCSISIMEMVSSSLFCSTSLSLKVHFSLAVFFIVSHETPAPFGLGCRNFRRLALSLDFSFVRRVLSFFSSWRLPSCNSYLSLSSRQVALIVQLELFSLQYSLIYFCKSELLCLIKGTSAVLWYYQDYRPATVLYLSSLIF